LIRALHAWALHPDTLSMELRRHKDLDPDPSGYLLGAGRVHSGFRATGSNHLEIPHEAKLDPARLTVEAWVKVQEFPGEGDTRRWLVNKNANEYVEGHFGLVLNRSRAGVYLNLGGGKENMFDLWTADGAIKLDQWHHLAFTYDGSVLRLYVDGASSGELAINRPRKSGTTALALACRQDGFVHFKGSLDEVRVYQRVLSDGEIKASFENPEKAWAEADGVVASWDFNQLTREELERVEQMEIRNGLYGPGGLLDLPEQPRPYYTEMDRQDIVALEKELESLQGNTPPAPALALAVDEGEPVELPVHLRGSHLQLAEHPEPRGFLRQVGFSPTNWEVIPPNRSGRLQLARWLVHPRNPLTARVVVNRIWQGHFGAGLVRTPENFGLRGDPPTHPELLDWLAGELQSSGWDVKEMHRLIMLSATYQQSASRHPGKPALADVDCRWLSRFPRQRLEAEMIRDSFLAMSGRLDSTMGGSLVSWKNNEYVPGGDKVAAGSTRRTVYLPIVRDRVYDVLTIFDFANPSVCSAQRTPTVVSHQALFFLNGPLVKESALTLAEQWLGEDTGEAELIGRAYERILNRPVRPGA
jgi:hypothetical protein